MQQVKILDPDETQINKWLAEHPSAEIIDVRPFAYGNGATGVLIRYEEMEKRGSAGAVRIPL